MSCLHLHQLGQLRTGFSGFPPLEQVILEAEEITRANSDASQPSTQPASSSHWHISYLESKKKYTKFCLQDPKTRSPASVLLLF